MDQKTIQEMSDREVFAKVFRNMLSSAFLFAVGAGVIVLISHAFWKIAVGLFVCYAIIWGIDTIWFLIMTIIPLLISIPLSIREGRESMITVAWALATTVVRTVELGVGLGCGWYIYRRLF